MTAHNPALGNGPGLLAETPVMQKFREWEAYTAWLKTAVMDDDKMEEAVQVQTDMEDAMMIIPAVNAQDFVAKVWAYSIQGQGALPTAADMPELWTEAKRLIGGAA